MTSPSKIFVEVSVTNKELMKVLTQIGFRDESSKKKNRHISSCINDYRIKKIKFLISCKTGFKAYPISTVKIC